MWCGVYFTENWGLLLTIGPCPYGSDNGYWKKNAQWFTAILHLPAGNLRSIYISWCVYVCIVYSVKTANWNFINKKMYQQYKKTRRCPDWVRLVRQYYLFFGFFVYFHSLCIYWFFRLAKFVKRQPLKLHIAPLFILLLSDSLRPENIVAHNENNLIKVPVVWNL